MYHCEFWIYKSFDDFAPALKEIIECKRKFATYRKKSGEKEYNILLKDYEPDFDEEKLDKIFGEIKEKVFPVVRQYIINKNEEKKEKLFEGRKIDTEKLEDFCNYLAEYIGFDKECGVIL